MASLSTTRTRRAFVILNPAAGRGTTDELRDILGRLFSGEDANGEASGALCEIHETHKGESIPELVHGAIDHGFNLVVAAGGDGTVSAVANGLVGTETPLGIIPLGTANVLARELGIPIDHEGACQLVAGPFDIKPIDAMRVAGCCYFTQVGIGIDAIMIRDTDRESKRRFGRVAYLWTAFRNLLGFQPRPFTLEADGKSTRPRASQVVIANSGILGQPPFRWGPGIRPDDGKLAVCVVRARTIWHYLGIFWHVLIGQHERNPNVRYLPVTRRVVISTKHPLPVQADGEIIGETPVKVEILPGAVRVAVPPQVEGTTST